MTRLGSQGKEFPMMNLNETAARHGFCVDRVRESKELHGKMVEMHHEKTGAQLAWVDNGEVNKTFCVAFKTLPEDSTGVFHILEHSVLCGSAKYPVREPFVELMKSSMATFLNAMTFPDKTIYPVSSRNEQDFLNLTEVYLDAVFAPRILQDPNIFYQEGWHIELDENGAPLYKGVVFNEMKGAMSDVDEQIYQKTLDVLFPDNCYGWNSGGDPKHIPDLTYEQFLRMYRRYYHPSNARIFLDGAIPLDKVLTLAEEYLSCFDRLDEKHEIPMQKPFAAEAEQAYEIGAEEDTADKTMLTLAKIVAPWSDTVRVTATEILFDVLTGSNDAPLKKALLATGKCQDVGMSLDNAMAQPYMMLTLRNIADGSEQELRQMIRDTVQQLVKTGLDKDALTASINSSEFSARQPGEPSGLLRCIHALDAWLYGGDPMQPLLSEERYQKLREMATGDGFDRLMAELLLDESTMSIIRTVPSHTQGDELRAEETERLQAIQASWTEADKEALCVQNEKLTAWQQTPDTAEQLATLPVLSLSEISADPLLIPAAEAQCGAAKVITHDLSMNGITIMHWYISLTDFTLDELKRLSILPELLGKLPTKRHDSLSLFQAIKRDIGKLTFQLRVMSRCAEMATPVLDVSCSVLDANVDKAAALVREILTETCFDDRARVQTLILQLSEMAKQKVISDGHRMAMYAASATMSAASAAREALNGLSACMVQKALAENFDAQYPDFLALCERFSKDSTVQSRVTFSLSTNKALDPAEILSAYPVGTPIPDAAPYVSDLPAKCAYRIPSQISFASLGYDYRRAGKVYSGIARVMSNILSLSYLWNEVRVQGGAYGAGLNTSETGRMVTYSYRDPSPARTLGIDRSMSKGLRDFVAGDERIDKYIISTVGESEPPLGSENQILVSDENLLCGITPEDLCRERAEMLSTTKDALLTWCGVLDQMAKDGGVCVIGHDGAIAACEKEDLTVL